MTTLTPPAAASPPVDDDLLRSLIRRELDELVEIRRDLHAHPELGYEETRTSGLVQDRLRAAGIAFEAGLARGTGVLGHLPGASEGAIGLRADMDALPIAEQTEVPHRSTVDGVMHACGHDGHTTMLIGAARVLAALAEESALPHPVTFCFQPAEEGGAGGRAMVEDGCLDGSVIGPPIVRMYGQHGWPQLALGTVGSRPGPILAAADMFEIVLRGIGAHAAYPQLGRDPIVAGAALVQALQSIVSRSIDPQEAVVVSVTQFHGGTTHNIIPEAVTLAGTVRTLSAETKATTVERLRAITESIARAHGCEAHVHYHDGYPVTFNDATSVAAFDRVAVEALGAEGLAPMARPVMGGEDFAYYGQQVPACFFALGLQAQGRPSMPQLHQPTFDFVDDALPIGIELFVRLALRGAA